MAKTQEELNEIKEKVEALNEKLTELTDEELAQVSGGRDVPLQEVLVHTGPVEPVNDSAGGGPQIGFHTGE